jgi:hypothetical protein
MLPNELIIEVIEQIFKTKTNVEIYKKLIKVNKYFKYYATKYFIKAFTRKYFKNIRSNLLYKRNSAFNVLSLFIIHKDKGTFSNIICKDFIDKDIKLISLPSILSEQKIVKSNNTKNITNNKYIINIENILDILQSFTIHGKNIKRVSLCIGGILIWQSFYLDANLINIQPLKNGIFYTLLPYYRIQLIIYADKCNKVYTYGKLIDVMVTRELRDISNNNPVIIPYVSYNNKRLRKNIVYCDGLMAFQYSG